MIRSIRSIFRFIHPIASDDGGDGLDEAEFGSDRKNHGPPPLDHRPFDADGRLFRVFLLALGNVSVLGQSWLNRRSGGISWPYLRPFLGYPEPVGAE